VKVVLSHPYSGALYWWLAVQSDAAPGQKEKRPRHGYYRTLYGDVDRNLDIALACCVIFEEVVLPGADAPFPGFDRYGDDEMRLAALELSSGWGPISEAQKLLGPVEDDLLRDPIISGVLRAMPLDARRLALLYAVADVLLTQAHSAPVLCAPGRRRVVLRLIELGVVEVPPEVAEEVRASHGLVEGLEGYVGVASLTFTSESIDRLAGVKWNVKIRAYADAFQKVLSADGADGLDPLLASMADAWSGSEVADEIGGAFSALGHSLGLVGLVPGVGTVSGLVGMGADGLGAAAERRAERLRWYELGPEIKRFESLRAIETELRERGLR
jgi:hypothetical protein